MQPPCLASGLLSSGPVSPSVGNTSASRSFWRDFMTLLLTWVAPDGIVLGADSAVTWPRVANVPVMTLSDAYKVIPFDREGIVFGVSFCGLAQINNRWTSEWLQAYVASCALPATIEDFAVRLADTLNGYALPAGQILAFHVAGWHSRGATRVEDVVPKFYEVSNLDRSTATLGRLFSAIDVLPPQFVAEIRQHRAGQSAQYPMHVGSAGFPAGFSSDYVAAILIPTLTRMVGAQIPQPHISSVAECVRLLIRLVADAFRVARQPAVVNAPVETLILFPEYHRAFSTRY
jgi:hypothetical protein